MTHLRFLVSRGGGGLPSFFIRFLLGPFPLSCLIALGSSRLPCLSLGIIDGRIGWPLCCVAVRATVLMMSSRQKHRSQDHVSIYSGTCNFSFRRCSAIVG
jgi:hypothetical protein